MAKFSIDNVEILEYDFESLGGKGKGVVNEPSPKDIKKFRKDFMEQQRKASAVLKELETLDDTNPEHLERIDQLQEEFDGDEVLTTLIVKLCKGSPSEAEVNSLPYRARVLFSTWLLKQFRPEA